MDKWYLATHADKTLATTKKVPTRLPTWGDVVGRPYRLLHVLVRREVLGQSKIDELDARRVSRRLHEPVLQLQVTVHNAVSVHIAHLTMSGPAFKQEGLQQPFQLFKVALLCLGGESHSQQRVVASRGALALPGRQYSRNTVLLRCTHDTPMNGCNGGCATGRLQTSMIAERTALTAHSLESYTALVCYNTATKIREHQ